MRLGFTGGLATEGPYFACALIGAMAGRISAVLPQHLWAIYQYFVRTSDEAEHENACRCPGVDFLARDTHLLPESRKVSACGEDARSERHSTFRRKLLYSTLACVADGRRAILPPIAADLLAGD